MPEKEPAENLGTAVLGAGPAGLTAAHVLSLRDRRAAVIEAEGTVGGIAKTVEFNGYRFDLGGHRFYTKLKPIQRLWEEALGEELLLRRRLSRIYFRGHFFNYPLRAEDVFRGLGVVESARCALSYVYWRRKLPQASSPQSFEDWVVSRFGRRLYDDFFRSYTQKVWGVPGSEIRAEWAAQRIRTSPSGTRCEHRCVLSAIPPDPDRGVSLSAARARADVGGLPRPDRGAAASRSTRTALRLDPAGREPRNRDRSRARAGGDRARRRRGDLDARLAI